MSLLALGHLLQERPMQKRFASDPLFQATLLLLQERVPKPVASFPHIEELAGIRPSIDEAVVPVRVI